MSRLARLRLIARAAWHAFMAHEVYDTRAVGDLVSIASCECGGYTQRRWADGKWHVELSTCPRVLFDQLLQTAPARVVKNHRKSPR